MARLSLYAIGITELRDMFGAAPELAEQLRAVTADRFPAPRDERRRGSLIGRIGPALKRPIDPPVAPARPTMADADALLAGRAIVPERLVYAWQVARAWLEARSWGSCELELDAAGLSRVEFDLARVGLPSPLALERLLQGNPQLPLRTLAGQRFGYEKNAHVEATRQGLSLVIGDLAETSLPVAGKILEFLNDFPQWSNQAGDEARPAPDLVAIWTD